MAVELKTEDFRLPGARQLLGVVLAGCFTVCAVNTVRQEIENPYLATRGWTPPPTGWWTTATPKATPRSGTATP
mgnify:FL=1